MFSGSVAWGVIGLVIPQTVWAGRTPCADVLSVRRSLGSSQKTVGAKACILSSSTIRGPIALHFLDGPSRRQPIRSQGLSGALCLGWRGVALIPTFSYINFSVNRTLHYSKLVVKFVFNHYTMRETRLRAVFTCRLARPLSLRRAWLLASTGRLCKYDGFCSGQL